MRSWWFFCCNASFVLMPFGWQNYMRPWARAQHYKAKAVLWTKYGSDPTKNQYLQGFVKWLFPLNQEYCFHCSCGTVLILSVYSVESTEVHICVLFDLIIKAKLIWQIIPLRMTVSGKGGLYTEFKDCKLWTNSIIGFSFICLVSFTQLFIPIPLYRK